MRESFMRHRGELVAKKITPPGPGLRWMLSNMLRWPFVKGWIAYHLIARIANWWGVATAIGKLEADLIRADGTRIRYGVVSYRMITDTGVAFMVDDWDNNTASATNDITTIRYHGCGTSNTAESVSDTTLGAESTTALNPDSTRATGTQSQPTANQLRSVGTLTFDASAAIVEHGILTQAATGGGTLWDRSVFSAINVVSGDSIQFTYTCTVSAGG